MSDIGFQRGHYLDYLLHGQPGDGRGSANAQVRIVLTSLGQGGHCVGSHPHEELFGSFGPHLLHQVMSNTIEVYKRHLQLSSHVVWRIQISPVGINQSGTCIHFCLGGIGINTLANIVLNNSLRHSIGIGFAKITADDGVEQNGDSTLGTSFLDETFQIGIESRTRVGMAFFVGFLVVVSELDEHVVAFFQFRQHLVPTAFVDKALRAASVDGMVVYHNLFREVAGEHLPPSTLRVSALQRLISHRGVADGKNGNDLLFRRKGRKHQKQAQQYGQFCFHHVIILIS